MKKLHIIHHNDLDGICGAAIVYRHYNQNADPNDPACPREVHFYETNYNYPPPVGLMAHGDRVVIVDFSYPPEGMEKIHAAVWAKYQETDITWIDHHKTAVAYGYSWPGLRDFTDKGRSGCELAWDYFFPLEPVPEVVRHIGDYDSWRLKIPESKRFYEGAKLSLLNPTAERWSLLLENAPSVFFEIMREGRTAEAYRDQCTAMISRTYAYRTSIAGIEAIAMNLYGFGSQQFGEAFHRYPIVIAYIHDGYRYTVSIYSETVDVAKIARAHGGGGHTGAAGFVCDVLPFQIAARDDGRYAGSG